MWEQGFTNYLQVETDALIEWAKCGESLWSTVPTLLWAVGTAALAHRMLAAVFRRFLFRRVPLWELLLQQRLLLSAKNLFQHLLFLWMITYSLHFWVLFVKIIKIFVDYCYEESQQWSLSTSWEPFTEDLVFQDEVMVADAASRKLMQQWVVWMCGVMPLAFYIHTRPRPEHPPLMIWITTSPWQRREMGPYGYYLNRPLSSLQSSTNVSVRQHAMSLRRAFSDSKIVKEPVKKKRYSKSV